MEYPMERTFSLEALAVVPTTHGFTSETPSAGSIRTNVTSTPSGIALRTGASQDALTIPTENMSN